VTDEHTLYILIAIEANCKIPLMCNSCTIFIC